MEQILAAIRGIIINAVDPLIFLPTNIKQGFQVATGDNFISYMVMQSQKTGVTAAKTYDSVAETVTATLLYEHHVQIDCYSNTTFATYANSANGASDLHNYLTSFGMDYLKESFPGITVGIVEDVANLSETLDDSKYVMRHTVRFTLFALNNLTRTQVFVDEIDVMGYLI